MHLPGHNFTGLETTLYKRLNPDGTSKEWSIPINRIDNAAYHNNLCYSKHDDTKTRNEVCKLSGIVNPPLRERTDKSMVGKLIKAKVNFGLGHPIKQIKNLLMSLLRNFTNQLVKSLIDEWLMFIALMPSGLLT